jgi:sulfate transport system ATP-binding protein
LRSSPWPSSRSSNGDTPKESQADAATDGAAGGWPGAGGVAVAIKARGLVKSFATAATVKGSAAVNGIDLDVAPGELMALLGPSGSGKTTLLRLVAGLETPTGGRILFGEEDATQLSVRHRRVGFVFQHYALFKHMSVAENVAYGLRVRPRALRPADSEIRRRVEALLELVQLAGLGRRYPAQLSGGQRQRVALARALAVEPRVLLLDEPFGALDAQVRRDLRRWLRELHDRTGHTTLFVTHDQEEALELADRVAILHRGRIEQVAAPDQILDRPASAFVASFVGEAARLPVHAVGLWISVGPHRIRQSDRSIRGAAELFVRPRDLVVAPNRADTMPARVVGLRRTATARRAELVLAEGLPSVEMELPADCPAARGDTLPVKLVTQRLFPVDGPAPVGAPPMAS